MKFRRMTINYHCKKCDKDFNTPGKDYQYIHSTLVIVPACPHCGSIYIKTTKEQGA